MIEPVESRQAPLAAAVAVIGGIITLILGSIVLFGEGAEDGPLQVAMTLGLTLAMVISMASGFSAEDLSASASKSINSALGTIFVLLAVGALIGALFLSGTIASVIYYGAQFGTPRILYILVFVVASVLSYAIGSSFTTIAAVGLLESWPRMQSVSIHNKLATHRLVGGRRVDVWNPEHRAAAEALALGWKTDRPDLRLIANDHDNHVVERLDLGGDYDVAEPDLDDRYAITIDAGEVSA